MLTSTEVKVLTVHIDVANKKVDLDPIKLSKKDGDQVEWFCDQNVTVHFLDLDPKKPGHNGTPFQDGAVFEVSKDGKVSGPIRSQAVVCEGCNVKPVAHHHYKYEILCKGKVVLDPEVIIRN
jgi:hypothetical protein